MFIEYFFLRIKKHKNVYTDYLTSILKEEAGKPSPLKSVAIGVSDHAYLTCMGSFTNEEKTNILFSSTDTFALKKFMSDPAISN